MTQQLRSVVRDTMRMYGMQGGMNCWWKGAGEPHSRCTLARLPTGRQPGRDRRPGRWTGLCSMRRGLRGCPRGCPGQQSWDRARCGCRAGSGRACACKHCPTTGCTHSISPQTANLSRNICVQGGTRVRRSARRRPTVGATSDVAVAMATIVLGSPVTLVQCNKRAPRNVCLISSWQARHWRQRRSRGKFFALASPAGGAGARLDGVRKVRSKLVCTASCGCHM